MRCKIRKLFRACPLGSRACRVYIQDHGGTAALVPPYRFYSVLNRAKHTRVGWNKRSSSTKLEKEHIQSSINHRHHDALQLRPLCLCIFSFTTFCLMASYVSKIQADQPPYKLQILLCIKSGETYPGRVEQAQRFHQIGKKLFRVRLTIDITTLFICDLCVSVFFSFTTFCLMASYVSKIQAEQLPYKLSHSQPINNFLIFWTSHTQSKYF